MKSELSHETIVVNYGEIGKRARGLGHTMEIIIQFISADTNELLCSCTGEGQGETDADDIRQAINSVVEFVS